MNRGPYGGHLDRGEPMVKPTARSVFVWKKGGDISNKTIINSCKGIKQHKEESIEA